MCSNYRIAGPPATFGLAEVRGGVGMMAGLMKIIRSMFFPNDLRRILQNGVETPVDATMYSGRVDPSRQCIGAGTKSCTDYVQIHPKAYETVKYQIHQHVIEALKAEIAKSGGSGPVPWLTAETASAMAKMI